MNIHRVGALVAVLALTVMPGAMAADGNPAAAPVASTLHASPAKPPARRCIKRSALGRCERWAGNRTVPATTTGRATTSARPPV